MSQRPPAAAASTAVLLDGNVLVALSDAAHVQHDAAEDWFAALDAPFATCPITQGTLLRVLLNTGAVADIAAALAVLRGLTESPMHRFWADDIGYLQVDWRGVLGHRQITDAYLASLARRHGGRLATFDKGFATLHADVAESIAS